jgi:hypothetical protein
MGITISPSYVSELEGNALIERFMRARIREASGIEAPGSILRRVGTISVTSDIGLSVRSRVPRQSGALSLRRCETVHKKGNRPVGSRLQQRRCLADGPAIIGDEKKTHLPKRESQPRPHPPSTTREWPLQTEATDRPSNQRRELVNMSFLLLAFQGTRRSVNGL